MREIYTCHICGKHFMRPEIPVSCCVNHGPGECCHFGDTEIEIVETHPNRTAIPFYDTTESNGSYPVTSSTVTY